jgi:hypothetical protein
MPSVNDVYNQILQVNTNLTSLINAVTNLTSAVVTIGNYTNQALYQNDQQNTTMICALEQISKNTCALLNESAVQTTLQTAMAADIDELEKMFATANPGAALENGRLAALKAQVEECCPPKKPPPPCDYKPCPSPKPIGPPPQSGGIFSPQGREKT